MKARYQTLELTKRPPSVDELSMDLAIVDAGRVRGERRSFDEGIYIRSTSQGRSPETRDGPAGKHGSRPGGTRSTLFSFRCWRPRKPRSIQNMSTLSSAWLTSITDTLLLARQHLWRFFSHFLVVITRSAMRLMERESR